MASRSDSSSGKLILIGGFCLASLLSGIGFPSLIEKLRFDLFLTDKAERDGSGGDGRRGLTLARSAVSATGLEPLLGLGVVPNAARVGAAEHLGLSPRQVRSLLARFLATRLPTSQPDEMNACLAAAMPMAKAWTFCIPSQRALGPG